MSASGSATTLESSIGPIHRLLAVQSLVVILITINRLTSLTTGYVLPNEFLRWVDFNNMLVLWLISAVAAYLLKKRIEQSSTGHRWLMAVNVAFIAGIYLLATSEGAHEVTNYLNVRFCTGDADGALCRIIIFNDDEFSHWVFFTGFVIINASLLILQVMFPTPATLSRRDILLLVANGVFIAAGIFANLAFEVIGLDLYIIAVLAFLALVLWWRYGRQPLVIYYTTAYLLALVATMLYKLFSG